jgi:hypothetical protein
MLARLATVKNLTIAGDLSSIRRFLDEGDEARARDDDERRLKRARERARRLKSGAQPDPEKAAIIEFMADRRQSMAASDRVRLEIGYRWWGGILGGERQEAFLYKELKSRDHPLIAAFVRCVGRRGRIKTGMTKAYTEEGASKLRALDERYVDGNALVRGFIRIELDSTFASWGHLAQELLDILGPNLMPHFGTAYVRANKEVVRPHLTWLLPFGNGIRWDDGAWEAPKRLYKAVARALCGVLLPLGADVGGLSNPLRVKNPCSPHWGVGIFNESNPLTLGEIAELLSPLPSMSELRRKAAVVMAAAEGVNSCESNSAFSEFQRVAFATVRAWHDTQDLRLTLDDRDALRAELFREIGPGARAAFAHGMKPRQAMAILGHVVRYVAEHFDPERMQGARPNRGCLRESLRGVDDLSARQRAGQEHVAQARRETSLTRIAAAIRACGGLDAATTAAVARAAGVSQRTVQRRWADAVKIFAGGVEGAAAARELGDTWCIVKKNLATRHTAPNTGRQGIGAADQGRQTQRRHLHASPTGHPRVRLPRLPEQKPSWPGQPIPWPGTTTIIPPGLGPLGRVRIRIPVPSDSPSGRRSPPTVPDFLRRGISASLTARVHLGGAVAASA